MNPQSSSLKKSSSLKDYETYSRNRIHSYIQIENTTATKWKDFINTPELGTEFVYYLDKHKISLESYVYSFTLSAAETPESKNPTKWTIRKRYVDFVELSGKINKEFASEKLLKEFLPQLAGSVNDEQAKSSVVPLRNLNAFLMSLIGNEFVRSKSQVLYEFLELSLLTLPEGTGKFKEGYMMKRPGGRYKESRCQIYCSVIFKRWLKRWCVVTNEGIIYCIDVNSTRVRETLLFDRSFQLEFGRKVTGTKRGIILSTSNRKLHLQAEDVFQAIDWIAAIRKAVSECPYVKENRYESFAPVRQPTSQCKWYVDGEGYFSDLCDALLKANKEVFITDWWLSPELYLKRPVRDENDTEFRLDKVLEKIASRGVKVNIILYREVKLALYNDSEYTKRVLQNLSPNIKVMRHPNQILFMWSHHEKMVVIDQSIGFLGGLDLCYGRMDLNSHPLHDPAFEKGEGNTFPGIDFSNSRQADFRNVRDFMTCLVDKHSHPRMPWHDIAMMVIGEPVRDLARHFIQYWNFAEIDLRFRKDRFLAVEAGREPPSSPRSQKQKKQNLFNMTLKGLLQTKQGKEPGTYYRLEEEKVATPKQPDLNKYLAPKVINTNERTVFGNTSNRPSNAPRNFSKITERESEDDESEEETKKDNKGSKSYEPKTRQGNAKFENDQKIGFDSEETALNDDFFDDDFRRRSSSMYSKSLNLKNENINTFLKMDINDPEFYRRRSYSDKKQKYAMRFNKQYNDLQKNIRQKEIHVSNDNEWYMNAPESTKLEAPIINRELANKFSITEEMLLELSYFKGSGASSKGTCSCQILRSASSWCLGLNDWEHKFENSIQVAYLDLIKNAKQFIYIENQFFISSTAGDPVTNEVVRALLFRIKKAYDDKEKFKVIVFLPLLPGFEGEVDNAGSTVLRIQLHWEYMTINRGGTSLYEELMKLGINPDDYIRFYSLRKHEKMNDVPVTEIIYIHSKLMIVDDEIVIMGSANINDRSMQGSRDSEIAIVVEDSEKVPAKINGVATLVPKFAHTLRKELYMEHLGASDEEVDDPLSDILLDKMNKAAERNTEIFRTVFACYPDDNIKKIAEVKDFKARKNLEEYDNLSKEIVGNIVQFPLQFLENDQLSFAMSDKEYYVPAISFT